MYWKQYVIIFLIVGAAGCELAKPPSSGVLGQILQKKTLVVLTLNSPTTYYERQEEWVGFEHDLAVEFAEYLGVRAQFEVYDSISEILEAMDQGKGDIAAAGLIRTRKRGKKYLFGPDYYAAQQQVVCHRSSKTPRKPSDLLDFQLSVIKDSSYEERLDELKQLMPDLTWTSAAGVSTEFLLEKVSNKELECIVADSNIVLVNRRYYPELLVAFDLTEEQPLAWIIKPGGTDLHEELSRWFQQFEVNGYLSALAEHYYSHLENFDYVDIRTFHKRITTRLPKLLPYFQDAAEQHELPWKLLAAQAYQESHWEENAVSPTKVRGIMMLTEKTAKQMGVRNRTDPVQSIMGGAKYFSEMLERVPPEVEGVDRFWFALAAYNVGMGHIYDARKLAKRLGKDPNQWQNMKMVLPLLSQRKYFKTLKHGYARGYEPVIYVQKIREFHDILLSFDSIFI
ncbi:MAG: membrane-bound lytic murein transglycosylase MltF [SAR324 cluster bacterium]|nr:membrane-bound lytic murein transglycosylase MltF [SAR324 cluster bacterium]